MGFFDTLLGRSRPVGPDLDRLFALPAAAITLRAGAGFAPSGTGSVCFAGVEGGAFDRLRHDIRDLLGADAGRSEPVAFSRDGFGYTWMVSTRPPEDTALLVNDLHAVNTLLGEGGFGPHLLCSLIAFRNEEDHRPLALVYLFKRGTFYPFAPVPGAGGRRDNALELRIRALLTEDLPVEKDLGRWFPVWGAPGLGE
jgi:hypothetical protein